MSSYLEPIHHRDWKDNNYLKISGLFSDEEVTALQGWVTDIEGWKPTHDKWMHHFEATPDGTRLSRSENFVPYHTGLKKLLMGGKVLDVVSELMGEPAVLYKEKINYKYPGGGGYAAHQDAPAYEFVTFHITCLISVDAATPENGCLSFSPGQYEKGFIALDEKGCIAEEVASEMEWVEVPTEPGDILLFGSYIPHKSGTNSSNQPRRIIYVTYNALSEGDWREQYYEDKRQTFSEYTKDSSTQAGQISKIGHFQGRTVLNHEQSD
jgi:hypothetical protein